MPTVFEVRVGAAARVGAVARVGAEAVTRPRSASARCGGIDRVGPSLAPGLLRVGAADGLVRRGPSAIGEPGAPGEDWAPLGAPGLAAPPDDGGGLS